MLLEVIWVDFSVFHAAFDQLDHPAFLMMGERWEGNPAACAFGVEPSALLDMTDHGRDSSVCLADQFYFLSVDHLSEGGVLLTLRPDCFLADQAASISSRLRRCISPALYAVEKLGELDCVRSSSDATRSCARLNHRLHQIYRIITQLDWCQPYSDRLAAPELTDLVKFLEDFVAQNQPLCSQKGLPISFQTVSKRLVTSVDRNALEYLLLTLLSNSLGFSRGNGTITITLKQTESQAVITYQDSNFVASPDLLSRMRWNQPESLDPDRGLGLGLPIAKRIASALGGTLVQTSSGKQGVGMALSIPLRIPPSTTLHAPILDRTGGYSMPHVLLSNALSDTAYTIESEDEAETTRF